MTTHRHSSFASQRSNLSALSASLIRFSKDLERVIQQSAEPYCDDTTLDDHTDTALDFIASLQDRLLSIEESLLQRTNDLLPLRDEQMTCTELSRLLRDLQTKNVQVMERLHHVLGGEKHPKWNNCSLSPPSPVLPNLPPVSTPFSTIVETDNETDGTPTPASTAFRSPPFSSRKSQPSTPQTPTLASLNLSTSTANVLHLNDYFEKESRISMDAIESWRAKRASESGSNGGSNQKPKPVRSEETCDHLEKSSYELQGSQYQHIVETHDYARSNEYNTHKQQSNEHDTTAIDNHALNAALRRLSIAPSESSMLRDDTSADYSDDDGGTYDDETTFASQPTYVRPDRLHIASLRGSREAGDRTSVSFVDDVSTIGNTLGRNMPAQTPIRNIPESPATHRVREVVVNMSGPSPGPTNLTMDQSLFHDTDTVASPSHSRIMDQADLASVTSLLVTPILDRYRLEADDSSIGIKVVPNERGCNRRKDTDVLSRKPFTESSNILYEQQTKRFRKTPHPKKSRKPNLLPIVENVSPRFSKTTTSSRNIDSEGRNTSVARSQISIPALPTSTPGIKDDRTTRRRLTEEYDSKTKVSTSIAYSTPSSKSTGLVSVSRTPLTAAWVAKHMSSDANLMESMGMEEVSFTEHHRSPHGDNSRKQTCIKLISRDEYEDAPAVVQMQVCLSEVNTAAEILSQWTVPQERVTESNAYKLLPFPEKKSKSILLSLCHWRRMMIHLEPNGERSFSLCC